MTTQTMTINDPNRPPITLTDPTLDEIEDAVNKINFCYDVLTTMSKNIDDDPFPVVEALPITLGLMEGCIGPLNTMLMELRQLEEEPRKPLTPEERARYARSKIGHPELELWQKISNSFMEDNEMWDKVKKTFKKEFEELEAQAAAKKAEEQKE